MKTRRSRVLLGLMAVSALSSSGPLRAAGTFTGRDGSLEIKEYLILESPRAERSHLDLTEATPGVRRYSGGFLPSETSASPKMYTFKAAFGVDPSLKSGDLSLYIGLAEYPYRVYLNGVEIFSKGRYQGWHYNSSLRSVDSVYLSPDILRYGADENVLALEAYPLYENWGLDRVYVDWRTEVNRAVFLRNFVGINLIQGAFVLSLIIGLYFLTLFLFERRKNRNHFIFSLICASFCLSYFNVTIHFDANDEVLLEALSKGGLILTSSFLLLFCFEFTSILRQRRAIPLAALALGAVVALLVVTRQSKREILAWFGYAMNYLIVPQLLADIGMLAYALIRNKNRYVLPILAAFVVIIGTAAHDVIYLNKAVLPYAWLSAYGYLAMVIAIFASLAREQGDLLHKSRQQTADLLVDQRRIELLNRELTLQKDSFFRFVPTQFLELLGRSSAVDIRLGDSSLRFLSILFSDIRRFATLSERMLPGENFEFLNSYLLRMEGAIQRNSGFVDKYIGDAIMALFAARNEREATEKSLAADAALVAALEMRRELEDFNAFLKGRDFPDVEIGIGVNTGEVMMGTVGSENRLDTTVIGDAVNLSSRLESLTKFYKTTTLVSEQTVHALVERDKFEFRLVDNLSVPGRTKPLMVYELLDPHNPRDAEKAHYAKSLDLAMSLYLAREFEGAGAMFRSIHQANSDDFLPRLFAERCVAYVQAAPPDDWNGVFKFSHKDFSPD
jgi:adenylate cyclase